MERETINQTLINNVFYDALGDAWTNDDNHPVALLRRENAARSPWVANEVAKRKGTTPQHILDIGCGAGFLTNHLASIGHIVTGIDLSAPSLEIAKKTDPTNSVTYIHGNAYSLPFPDESFDVVSAMDILEHVENPSQLIAEASRVLKKNGLFFFHTFNRNLLSYLVIIKGVEWFVKNTPPNMHVYSLFIKPKELTKLCEKHTLQVDSLIGLVPDITKGAFWKMLVSRKVPRDFGFTFVKTLSTGYCGIALK